MVEDKIEEETYSLIFTSLKHPIRRRILRMLADKPLAYSEILEILNIDSGHLSYHLENLGDLTVHSSNGQYRLSSFGDAAVKLMGGVEEQKNTKTNGKNTTKSTLKKIYPIILALALIGASFHLVTYSRVTSTWFTSSEHLLYPLYTNVPLNLSPNETCELFVTIEYNQFTTSKRAGGLSGGYQNWTLNMPEIEKGLTSWDEATIWLDSRFNMTSLLVFYDESFSINMQTRTNKTITVTTGGWGLGVNPCDATDPSNLELKVYNCEEIVSSENFYNNIASSFDSANTTPVTITQPTSYTFQITNKGEYDWNGFLVINLQFLTYERPYFHWGIAGIIIALGYIVVTTTTTIKTRNKSD
jgi:hypothetical protein